MNARGQRRLLSAQQLTLDAELKVAVRLGLAGRAAGHEVFTA